MDAFGSRIGREVEAVELADMLGAKRHRAGIVERQAPRCSSSRKCRISSAVRRSMKRCGQTLMQRIREAILDRARDALPMRGIARPALFVRGIGPGADLREAARKRVDVAIDDVQPRDLAREPVFRQHAVFADQMAENLADQARMFVRRQLAEVGQLTGLPQEAQRRGRRRERADLLIIAQASAG